MRAAKSHQSATVSADAGWAVSRAAAAAAVVNRAWRIIYLLEKACAPYCVSVLPQYNSGEMIVNIRSMIERCIGRMRAGACETCDHRDACVAAKWQQSLAFAGGASPARAPSQDLRNAFPAFLGGMAEIFARTAPPRKQGFRR